jgi:uncharacterized protein YPO0396
MLLREQSDQNLTLLSTRLDQERKAILERLELVNESLISAEFNPGTHLVIAPMERSLEDVKQFKSTLKEALSQSFSGEPAIAEQRFQVLSALVKRIASQEAADKNWRSSWMSVSMLNSRCGIIELARNPIDLVVVKGASKRIRAPRSLTVEQFRKPL